MSTKAYRRFKRNGDQWDRLKRKLHFAIQARKSGSGPSNADLFLLCSRIDICLKRAFAYVQSRR